MKTYQKRLCAAALAAAIYIAGAVFVAWGVPPGDWPTIGRLIFIIGFFGLPPFAAAFPFDLLD